MRFAALGLTVGVAAMLAESTETAEYRRQDSLSTGEKIERALKQVQAIQQAVGQGQDQKAESFLKQLIASQIDDDHEYVVKSLCNIAQRCADLRREL